MRQTGTGDCLNLEAMGLGIMQQAKACGTTKWRFHRPFFIFNPVESLKTMSFEMLELSKEEG